MPTYSLIASSTLTSAQASVNFTSIPNTYTDLVLRLNARTDLASNGADLAVRFNSNSATDYSSTWIYANTSPTASRQSSSTYYRIYQTANGTADTASVFGPTEIYIARYASTGYKPMWAFGASENLSGASWTVTTNAGLYIQASAISSINIFPVSTSGYNFVANSTFYLYGIKNT